MVNGGVEVGGEKIVTIVKPSKCRHPYAADQIHLAIPVDIRCNDRPSFLLSPVANFVAAKLVTVACGEAFYVSARRQLNNFGTHSSHRRLMT
jgi:hypothetical protein